MQINRPAANVLARRPTTYKKEALARWVDHLHAVKTQHETKTEQDHTILTRLINPLCGVG